MPPRTVCSSSRAKPPSPPRATNGEPTSALKSKLLKLAGTPQSEAAFTAGHERAAASLTEHANALLSAYHQEADHHTINLRAAAADLTEKSSQMEALRAFHFKRRRNTRKPQRRKRPRPPRGLEQHSARLKLFQQHALTNFQTQADDVLNLHRNELHRLPKRSSAK